MASFDSLHRTCVQLQAQERLELFMLHCTAARGDSEGVKALTKQYEKQSGLDTRLGEADFLRKYGKGI